jgi:KipI family sensor histidine kinase inhibitor
MGDGGLLCEAAGADEVAALYAALRADAVEGVEDLVPAARTLLVRFDPRVTDHARIGAVVAAAARAGTGVVRASVGEVVIPVRYDGADLADVAASAGLDADGVVAAHTAGVYTVAFFGFAPGFAYLTGLDPALHVSRLDRPRTRVPAGSVAVAGPYTAVYPRATPGGWRLLGHTSLPVWDLAARPPGPLAPGTRVRFVAQG